MMPFSALRLRNSVGPVPSGDPYFSNVVSLLHFDGTDGSTVFTDIKGRAWAADGAGTQISTNVSKFGGASLLLTGGGGLRSDSLAGSNFGTEDYTVELWLRRGTASSARQIFDSRFVPKGSTIGLSIYHINGYLQIQAQTNQDTGFLFAVGTWYHLAVARESGTLRTFVDGVLVATQTDTRNYTGGERIDIGQTFTRVQMMVGNIDDLRITKGVARYTASFTTPTEPFPNS